MANEDANYESGEHERYAHVADRLKDLGADIELLLPEKGLAGLRFIDANDELGNTLTIGKTSPSTPLPLGFAYIVQRRHNPRNEADSNQLVRYSWHPVIFESRQEQHYFRSGAGSGEKTIEDRGFDLHDIAIIEGIIKGFKSRRR